MPGVVQEPLHPQTDNGNGRPVAADVLIASRDFSIHFNAAPLIRDDPVGQFPMCLPALPALHDTEAPDLRKLTVRVFGESPNFSPARPAHKEIAGTAGAKDKFGISQMARAVRVFFRLPDADHDSLGGDLLPAPDPLCLRARFFGFIALVFPGAMPPHHYTIFFRQNSPALRQFAPASRQVTPAIARRGILSLTYRRDRFNSLSTTMPFIFEKTVECI